MKEAPVINDVYNLIKWYGINLQSFPRNHRYGLGLRIESSLHDILKALLQAKFQAEKAEKLKYANIELEFLRFMSREAFELKLIDSARHRAFLSQIDNIGRQLGGWLKSLEKHQ